MCELFLHLAVRGVIVLFAIGDNGVGPEDCNDQGNDRDGFGHIHFVAIGVTFYLSLRTQAQVRFTYQSVTVSQAPGLPASGGTTGFGPEVARTSPVEAFRTILYALTTRMLLCLLTFDVSATCIAACTSVFCPDLFKKNMCSPIGRGIPDIAAQELSFASLAITRVGHTDGFYATDGWEPVRLARGLRSLFMADFGLHKSQVYGLPIF